MGEAGLISPSAVKMLIYRQVRRELAAWLQEYIHDIWAKEHFHHNGDNLIVKAGSTKLIRLTNLISQIHNAICSDTCLATMTALLMLITVLSSRAGSQNSEITSHDRLKTIFSTAGITVEMNRS